MIPFKPVIEPPHPGAFMEKHPFDIIKSGEASLKPTIFGVTSSEGALRAASIFGVPNLLEEFDKNFDRIVPISLLYDLTCEEQTKITKQIRQFYFGESKINNSSREQVTNVRIVKYS